jgi:Methylase involved in ubiquinone/menaquinone biosynthesis
MKLLRENSYYTKKRAAHYNRTWRTFSQKTHTAALSLLDIPQLHRYASRQGRPLRILDAACGTGILLAQIASLLPESELYGNDASSGMIDQAAHLLRDYQQVHLLHTALTNGETAGLPYAPAFFDLILCTNALHYLRDPVATLMGLRNLLVPTGQMVIEDYTLQRYPSFLYHAPEGAIRLYDPQHVRLYTPIEARTLCQQADLQVKGQQTFQIGLFCRGWAFLLS